MGPKAKPGEGIVVIIDVGPSVRASSSLTFYSQAKECLIHILQRKIFADKCRDMVGVVLLGSDETNNKLATGDQYKNISVLQPPKLVDWNLIKNIERLPRGSSSGDWLDALVVAMDLLCDPQDIYFSTKKIVMITDFSSKFSDDQITTIIQGLKRTEIELSVIGPVFHDDPDDPSDMDQMDQAGPSNGTILKPPNLNWNGKPKSNVQLAGETLIRRIVSEVDGMICSFDEAIPQLIFFEKKSQGSANWNVMLEVGSSLKIPVVGKIKVKHATYPTWKKVYAKDENSAIVSESNFRKLDVDQTIVEEDNVISGYRYGTTLVPFSDEDQQLRYSSNAQSAELSILGFTHSSHVPLGIRAGDQVMIITARDHDQDAAIALSSLIQGLSELDMVAITRKIYRKNLNPVMGVLFPDITSDYECLVWIGLPFQEDVRNFAFPSLEKTTDNLTQEQRDAMDQLIDSLDLSAKKDEEDDDEEFDPTLIVNPQLQHFFNCLTNRAINPDEPLPPPSQHILDLLKPSERRSQMCENVSQKLSQLFPLKKEIIIKKKKQIDISNDDENEASTSGLEDALPVSSNDLKGKTVTKITSATPASDFKTLLSTGDLPNYYSICKEMEDVVLHLVETLSGLASTDDILLPKIREAMKAFRQEAIMIDPTPYNNFMEQLKRVVSARAFQHLWLIIKQEKLGQISQNEALKSKITEEESEKFLELEQPKTDNTPSQMQEDDAQYDEMLDDL